MKVISLNDVVATRAVIWIMLFTSCWVVYMVRVNMSLNIIAMVDSKKGQQKTSEQFSGLAEGFENKKPEALEDILSRQREPIIITDELKNGSLTDTGDILSTQTESPDNKSFPQSGLVVENTSPLVTQGDISNQDSRHATLNKRSLRSTVPAPFGNATLLTQDESTTETDVFLLQSTPLQPRNRSQRYSETSTVPADDKETIKPVKNPKTRSKGRESDETYDWSEQQQGLILGSYFWFYPVTSLVGGTAAERWGTRSVVFWASIVMGIFTALGPPAAKLHYGAVVFTRAVIGAAGGLVYPAGHALIARWVPPNEKGKFVAAMQGGTLGTVATWSLSGVLMEEFGWPSAFYCPAAINLVWCLIWCYAVANSPAIHPRISETEKKYIEDSLGNRISKSRRLPPYKKIATSVPFIAMVILHYGNLWGLFFIMTVGPKFMASILGFKLSAAGFVSGLPYLARLIFAGVFGVIGDTIQTKKLMTTTMIRKVFCIFSHILPGLLLGAMVYIGTSTVPAVTVITLSMGFNGAATLTNLQNHQDLAPNFAGTLYGIANFVGSTAGFFAPMLTAHFTKNGNTFENWRPVFFLGGAIYILAAFIYFVLGSGEVQPWNFESSAEGAADEPSRKTAAPDKSGPQDAQTSK